MAIEIVDFPRKKWWFSIVMLNYQRIDHLEEFWGPHWTSKILVCCWLNPHVLRLKKPYFFHDEIDIPQWFCWWTPFLLLSTSLIVLAESPLFYDEIILKPYMYPSCSSCFPCVSPLFPLAKCPCSVAVEAVASARPCCATQPTKRPWAKMSSSRCSAVAPRITIRNSISYQHYINHY